MSSSSLNSSSHPYYGPERMVISIDVGNSFSSVCLAHLTFGCTPSSLIRTVASYPSFPSSTATPPLPSRHPSAIYYDRHDRARAFGAEVTTPLARVRAKAEAWLLVDGWKEQMRPADAGAGVGAAGSKKEGQGKKLAKKSAKSSPFLSASPSAGSAGLLSTPGASGSPLTRSVTPESLVDAAVDAEGWEVLEEPSTPKGGKRTAMYNGPLIRTIYADLLRHLVAW